MTDKFDPALTAPIWISPGRMNGGACMMGTRIPVEDVAKHVWHDGVAGFIDNFGLTDGNAYAWAPRVARYTVLASCAWWTINLSGRLTRADRFQRDHWLSWALSTWDLLWHGVSHANFDTITDPPHPARD